MEDTYAADTSRTVTEERAAQPTHTTTVIHENRGAKSSNTGIMLILVLLVGLVGAFVFMSQSTSSETKKDNAIAQAADNVGDAATKVGDAAQSAADNVADK